MMSRLKYRNILAGLLLLIVSAYHVNSTMFFHEHIINGQVINHSHFFSKVHTDSSEDGGHTVEIVKLISHLTDFSVEEQDFNTHIIIAEALLESEARAYNTSEATFYLARCRSLRAPPRV